MYVSIHQVDGVDRRTVAGKPTKNTWGDSGIRQDERMELERLRLAEVMVIVEILVFAISDSGQEERRIELEQLRLEVEQLRRGAVRRM